MCVCVSVSWSNHAISTGRVCMWVCHSVGSASWTTGLATLCQTKTERVSMCGYGILSIYEYMGALLIYTYITWLYMTVITSQLVANPHYISRSSSHNFSQVYIAVFCDIKSTSSLHRAARCFPLFPSLDRSEGVYSYWWRVVHSAAGHPGGSRRATPATPSFSAPWDINSMIGR